MHDYKMLYLYVNVDKENKYRKLVLLYNSTDFCFIFIFIFHTFSIENLFFFRRCIVVGAPSALILVKLTGFLHYKCCRIGARYKLEMCESPNHVGRGEILICRERKSQLRFLGKEFVSTDSPKVICR